MLKTWKLRLFSAALLSALAAVGCYDFGDARQRCVEDERCEGPPEPPCIPTGTDDEPGDFVDANCDGIDGVATAGIYVDPNSGENGNPGTREQPLKTIGAALELLHNDAGAGITALYLASGVYHEDGLVLDAPVSLHGAYGGITQNWQRKPEYTSIVDGGTVGLTVRALGEDSGVRVEWLTIASADATDAGMPSIALRVLDTQGLRLDNTTLIAGKGASGAPGRDGDAGTDGPDGGPGQSADLSTPGGGGPGGGGMPGHGCGSVFPTGGAGKRGGAYDANLAGSPGNPGSPLGTPGGDGGSEGTRTPTEPPNAYFCYAGHGQAGQAGPPGDAGIPGVAGAGIGEIRDGTWLAIQQSHGGAGQPGTPGAGGGGGGSGGACPPGDNNSPAAGGGGSGGGGAGGCGGEQGQGGGPGGASISLLLIDSTVQLGKMALITRGGGSGGSGGAGGRGGYGGIGGPGGDGGEVSSSRWMTQFYATFGGAGGAGGNGGAGGPGGAGGGGAGGPSVGIWCSTGGVLTTEGATLTETLGPGGAGGPSSGSRGADGGVIRFQDCNPSPP